MDYSVLRNLPQIDAVLRSPQMQGVPASESVKADLVRQEIDSLRAEILSGARTQVPALEEICTQAAALAKKTLLPHLRRVINATGISLHTNLGRACLSEQAAKAAGDVARNYSNLEFNLETGSRGSRYDCVEELLCKLTGAEAAMVVNNNAAAVLLILSAMASGGEVVISRGELVEIGGSFRVPEIMEQCGCILHEVGTTNKTHPSDYQKAIGENTRALLKVHTSNYRIVGFTESVSAAELAAIGREVNLPVIEDIGSGCLIDLNQLGIHDEPTVMQSIEAGVDIVSFSGDKLLGGPQAGIIVGKKEYLDILKHHPLTRAVRIDKLTLAALEATLRSYLNPRQALQDIPVLRMLGASQDDLKYRAVCLCRQVKAAGFAAEVIPEQSQVGGGSVPCQTLPTFAVAVTPERLTVDQLDQALRSRDLPIVGRISHDRYVMDVRTLREEEFDLIAAAMQEAMA